jgi:hypothetical protein
LIDARRTAALARPTSASVVLVGILAVAVMTACSPRFVDSPQASEAVPAAAAPTSEPAPSKASGEPMSPESAEALEYREYSKYILG